MSSPVEDAIFQLLAQRGPGKSIDPADAAKLVDPEGWRRMLSHVRTVSIGLARLQKLVILRHNKPANPNAFKGVYRLRLPMEGDPIMMETPPEEVTSDSALADI